MIVDFTVEDLDLLRAEWLPKGILNAWDKLRIAAGRVAHYLEMHGLKLIKGLLVSHFWVEKHIVTFKSAHQFYRMCLIGHR